MKTMLALSLGILLGMAVPTAVGQTRPPPLPPLPGGFQADPAAAKVQAQLRASGMADAGGGTKANEEIPGCPKRIEISFGYGWTTAYMDKTTAHNLSKAPQDPAKNDGAYLDEPVGKKAYKNGVLEWRKDTETIAGGHAPCPDKVVYYDGKWMGYLSNKAACQPGKIVTISVTFLYNSQQGQAWIDEYIDKLTEALSSKKPVRCGATGPTLAGSHSEVNSRAAIEGVGQP
jgi:hypothetical protein